MTYIDIMAQDTIDEHIVKLYVTKLILLIQLWVKVIKNGFKKSPLSITFSSNRSDTAPTVPNTTQ